MADEQGHRIIIRQTVPDRARLQYEEWLRRLHEELRAQPGFEAVEVVHQSGEGSTRYLIVASFTGEREQDAWLKSKRLAHLRAKLDGIAGTERDVKRVRGREIWFDDPGAEGAAPYWKRVALTSVCVLPTLWLTEWLIAIPGVELPELGHQVLSVVILSALLTWPIMPYATRLVAPWLGAGRGRSAHAGRSGAGLASFD